MPLGAAMGSADSRLRVITDALPVGIAYVDQDKIYRFANQRFAAAYGLGPEAIIGLHADAFIWRDAMVLGDPFFEAAHSGRAVDFIHPARHADGRMLTVRTFLRPDATPDGAVHGFYVCSINVTQQKEAEAALTQAQKMDAVGQLASGIAHDFNNLLAIILGNLLPLRDEDRVDPHVLEEYIAPAIRAAEQGARLTSRLLAMARKQPLRPERIDVEDCLADFLRLMRRTLPATIGLSLDCRGSAAALHIDRAQLETALLNLCLNARDAMPDGGDIRIEVDYPPATARGRFVRLAVSDTGPGIDPAARARIFEPFFTTKEPGKGTGLGLGMVWGFVRQSRGTIDVENRPEGGARFTMLLPAAEPGEIAEPEPRPAVAGRGLVLVVDDNHDLRHTVRRQLAGLGYAVLEAEGGAEALELVRGVPDLRALVTDVVMPGMSGFHLAREAGRLRPELRIVLMTGFDAAERADRGDLALPVLSKPFDPRELLRVIEAAPAARPD
ncbi:MAG: hybrid sensor histidine kinase/response regulator [Rhodovulum sulfidophilum]|uniref:histidine kinase n=1 Tax=Rhodovulum sulfidophilum TaxID=35806 RepID=A0A2W5N8X3_RHOSU|nr:MAG: hybrid sensor histidine kinase/response regulator [Rhodovulum sulfidophilum]